MCKCCEKHKNILVKITYITTILNDAPRVLPNVP